MPLMVPRYLFGSLVAFFALAALGAASVENRLAVLGLAAALAFVSLQRIHRHFRRPQGAAVARSGRTRARERGTAGARSRWFRITQPTSCAIACPPAVGSSRLGSGDWVPDGCGPARVAILAGATYVPDGITAKAHACYPRVLAELRKLEVRAR